MLNLDQVILGKTAVLVILIIIHANLCDYLVSPIPWGNNLHLYIDCICIYIIVFYFVFSAVFIGVGQNLINLIAFWLYVCSLLM